MSSTAPWMENARDHLERALAEADAGDKDFHIRAALQELGAAMQEAG